MNPLNVHRNAHGVKLRPVLVKHLKQGDLLLDRDGETFLPVFGTQHHPIRPNLMLVEQETADCVVSEYLDADRTVYIKEEP